MYEVKGKAHSFAGAGMSVVLADIERGPLDLAVSTLVANGHQAIGVRTDVSDESQIQALAQAALDEFGAIHVVSNNAGIGIGGAVDEMSLDDWKWTIDVDLWSVIFGIRTFLPILKAQGEDGRSHRWTCARRVQRGQTWRCGAYGHSPGRTQNRQISRHGQRLVPGPDQYRHRP